MWRIEQPTPDLLPDVERFLKVLNTHTGFFEADTPISLARAPGRLDLMGGIADYSGSLVLEFPLAVATLVAVQPALEPIITMLSTTAESSDDELGVSLPLESLLPSDRALDYAAAHMLLTADPQNAWAAYVAGAFVLLRQEHGLAPQQGMRIFIYSEVPIGKGVSSSAALEVATMQAVCAASDLDIKGRDMALLCQKVENFVVGAPCGVMDQMTAACGEQNSLLALLCQPAELRAPVSLPTEVEVWGIDSGIRHAISGADYGSVRVGAFMGYRIIAEQVGLSVTPQGNGVVDVADPIWQGYLANISPSLWETTYRDQVPLLLDGATFLEHYRGSTDLVTQIDPERVYAVRQPTAHPIYEHHRVQLFRTLLMQHGISEEQLSLLGELMYQSHASYSACGLGSEGTDKLVEMVSQAGRAAYLYGAKITGGGSGGTVAILARRGARKMIEQIAARYEAETGHNTSVLGGSSPGATTWGVLRLIRE